MIIPTELKWSLKYSYFHLFYCSVLSIQEEKTLILQFYGQNTLN